MVNVISISLVAATDSILNRQFFNHNKKKEKIQNYKLHLERFNIFDVIDIKLLMWVYIIAVLLVFAMNNNTRIYNFILIRIFLIW